MAIPKKVEERIKDLERQRDIAVRALNDVVDGQTPSGIYVQRADCTGEKPGPTFRKVYIQTHTLEINHAGVKLHILLREDKVDISFDNSIIGEVVSIYPQAANSIAFAASKPRT